MTPEQEHSWRAEGRRKAAYSGREPTAKPSVYQRCKKILSECPPAKAYRVVVDLETWAAARQMAEHVLETRLRDGD